MSTDDATAPHGRDDAASSEADEPTGALPRLSRRAWVGIGVGVAALTAATIVLTYPLITQPVRWQDVGYTVDSPFAASATFDVFFYTDQPVVCQVRALNMSFAEVGGAQVRLLAADGKHQRVTVDVPTTETANTAVVDTCAVDDAP